MDKKYQKMIGYTENGIVGFLDQLNHSDLFLVSEDEEGNVKDVKLILTLEN